MCGVCWLLGLYQVALGQKPELIVHSGHSSAVENVWLSPDENILVSQSIEKLVFWDVKSQRILREVTNVKNFFISPNNKVVATLDKEYIKLDLWEVKTGRFLNTIINFSDWSFSQDGEKLVAGYTDGILLWDSASNSSTPLQIPTKETIRNCSFGPQNKFVVFSTQDDNGTVYIANTDSFQIYILAKDTLYWSLTPDGKFLMVQDRRGAFRSSEILISGDKIYQKLIFSREGVDAWRLSPNMKYVMLADKDGSGIFFEINTGQNNLTVSTPRVWTPYVWQLDFTPDGEFVYGNFYSEVFSSYNINRGTKLVPVQRTDYHKVDFGHNGKALFTNRKSPETSFLWDLNKGQHIFTMSQKPGYSLIDAVFSSDGQSLATIKSKQPDKDSTTYSVSVWNLQTGEEKHIYEFSKRETKGFNFYNTGTGFGVGRGGSGPTIQPITFVSNGKHPVEGNLAFNNSGDLLIVGEQSGNISICDVTRAKQLAVLKSQASPVQVFFTNNGTGLNIYRGYNTYRLWDSDSGTFSEERVKPAFKSNDDKNEVFEVERKDKAYTLRYKKDGTIAFQAKDVEACKISPDNRKVLCTRATTVEDEYSVQIWDIASKKNIINQTGVSWSDNFSPDGKYLSLRRKIENGFQAEVWDITNNELKLKVPSFGTGYFSPDSRVVAFRTKTDHITLKNLGVEKYSLELWSLADEKKILSINNVFEEHFSQDGRDFIAILEDRIMKRDLRIQESIETQFTPANNIYYVLGGVTFSRTGPKTNSWVFFTKQSGRSEHESGVVFLWNTRRNQLYTLKDHSAQLTSAEFSLDEKHLLTSSEDGTIRLWDTDSGQLLLTFVLINKSDWLVMTPEGFFDGTPNAWKQLLWRFNNNNLEDASVELYFNDFFHPNLFQDVIAGKSPKAKAGQELEKIDRRQPKVEIVAINGQAKSRLEVQSADQSTTDKRMATVLLEVIDNTNKKRQSNHQVTSGAQDLRLFRNGLLVKVWSGDIFNKASGCEAVQTNPNEPRRVRCQANVPIVRGDNNFTAYAFNSSNVKSNDDTLTVKGADSLKRAGTLYVLAIGVGQYENPQYNLNYTVADAQSFGEEVKQRQEQIRHYERVEIISLLNNQAKKINILTELKKLAETIQPEDGLIVYFSGHGTAQKDRFYLIPYDIGYMGPRKNLSSESLQAILAKSISNTELEEAFRGIDAGQLLLVIDACNSGQALDAEERRRGPMNSKGLAQLAYEKGMYVLTASQSVELAFESEALKHSYLTYALVEEGLKSRVKEADANNDGQVWLREWFDYTAQRVPRMREEKVEQKAKQQKKALELVEVAEQGRVQTPRVFYRREADPQPWVVAQVR